MAFDNCINMSSYPFDCSSCLCRGLKLDINIVLLVVLDDWLMVCRRMKGL